MNQSPPSPDEVAALTRVLTGQSSDESPPLSPAAARAHAEAALTEIYAVAEEMYPVLTVRQGFHFAVEPGSGTLVVSVWDDVMWRTIGEIEVDL